MELATTSTLLAKRLLQIEDNTQEEYILTDDEATNAIEYALVSLRRFKEWKLLDKGAQKGTVEQILSEIDWSEELDIERILTVANSNKIYQVWQEETRKKEAEELIKKQTELKEMWTARRFLSLMRWTSKTVFRKELIEDDYTLPLISAICFFMSGDERFEQIRNKQTGENFSLKKGLLIRGICGLGKTYVVKCISENELAKVSVLSMLEIADSIRNDGEYTLPLTPKIYIDDVGSEEPVIKHYGTNINWFKNFIETYYLRSSHYNKIILSTNNSFAELERKYGFRVRSRMAEMFNTLTVEGVDLRMK